MIFWFWGSWDYAYLVRIKFSSKLPQELRQIVEYGFKLSPRLKKNAFQHFRQKLNFCWGFQSNRLGQNDRNDRGIISGFQKNNDFDMCFAGQSQCFPENLDFYFLCLNKWFLFGRQIREEFICLEYQKYNHVLFSKHIYPIHVMDFIDFQRFL